MARKKSGRIKNFMPADAHSIPGCFAQVVARHAGRMAVSAPDAEWSYAELDRHSSFIAGEIISRSGESSEPVVLLMEHGAWLIAGILGVLKAGRIYLALDSGEAGERLATMIADSGSRLILTDGENLATANSLAAGQIEIWQIAGNLAGPSINVALPEPLPENGAWLMYTSGSTGTPKGVWQDHCGVVHHTRVYSELIGLSPDDRLSLLTACHLAASATHLFGALLTGATLCLFNVRTQGIGRLAIWLKEQRITMYHSVPTVFRQLAPLAGQNNSFATVRVARLGGEPVLRGDVELFHRHCPENCRLMHALSSTETGLISAFLIDRQTTWSARRLPVGRAVRGAEVRLLDETGQPVLDGGEGKIAVHSAHLARGYWRQPGLTAEKFRAAGQDSRLRTFVSDDRGRFLADGLLEHLGRADQVVKIRGQRVDLGEVETALLATGLAQAAVATAMENEMGEKRLVAHLVPVPGADVTRQNFRRKLQPQLPEHMLPEDFVALEKLPVTAAGKTDRRALPPPPPREIKTGLNRAQRPRDVIDTRLQRIWEAVLKLSPIGRTDDFFDLGGTSLQSVEVSLQIEELFGVFLPPSTLVEHNTIEKLSALLADRAVIRSSSPLVKLRDGGGHPLFLIHSGQGDVATYGLLTRRLPDRAVYGLQSIGLQGEGWPLMSVPAMAQRYLPEILDRDPTGPYLLAGACMGGMVAFELAQMLRQQGKAVGLLGLMDTLLPTAEIPGEKWHRKIYVSLRTPIHEHWRMWRWRAMRAAGLTQNARRLPAYRRFIANLNGRAHRHYRPSFYPGEITLFITAETKFPQADPRLRARQLAQTARVLSIPGGRAGLFMKPAVDELARQLQACLQSAENKSAA